MKDKYLQIGSSYDRLYKEYKKHGSLCIGYDFDGTVHDFHNEGVTFPHMIELLQELREVGCKLICWTAYKDHAYVSKYLDDNNIPCDGINTDGLPLGYESRKPFFSVLLDDRAGLLQVYWELKGLVRQIKIEQNDTKISESL